MLRDRVVCLALLVLSACSKAADAGTDLPQFHDVADAPPAIRAAARAVVRIRVAEELATGSFISGDGLLLTNNHVLGVDVCPVEGCWVDLTFLHQRGETPASATTAFVVPRFVDVGLDVAVLQAFTSPGSPLVTPEHLTIDPRDARSLLGAHIHVIGHPEGHLKKWSSGTVVDALGNWFESTAYILPGSSGSPVLSDDGRIVGIMHRAPTGEDLVTSRGYAVDSLGTASASIADAMLRPLPSTMLSTKADTTKDAVVRHNLVYLNARAAAAIVAGQLAPVLDLLGSACDAAIARSDLRSPEDFYDAIQPCVDATYWIECRMDAGQVAYGASCPAPADRNAWSERFAAVDRMQRALNGRPDLSFLTFAQASLQSSMSDGSTAGATSLRHFLDEAQPPLDFTLANYLAAFGVRSYANADVVDFVRSYRRADHWQLFATTIASSALWFSNNGSFTRDETIKVLEDIANDPNVTISTKLYVEDVRYRSGVIK